MKTLVALSLLALGPSGWADQLMQTLEKALRHPDPWARQWLVENGAGYDTRVQERLLEIAEDLDSDRFEKRRRANTQLYQLGEVAVPTLEALSAHKVARIRRAAQSLLNSSTKVWTYADLILRVADEIQKDPLPQLLADMRRRFQAKFRSQPLAEIRPLLDKASHAAGRESLIRSGMSCPLELERLRAARVAAESEFLSALGFTPDADGRAAVPLADGGATLFLRDGNFYLIPQREPQRYSMREILGPKRADNGRVWKHLLWDGKPLDKELEFFVQPTVSWFVSETGNLEPTRPVDLVLSGGQFGCTFSQGPLLVSANLLEHYLELPFWGLDDEVDRLEKLGKNPPGTPWLK